MKLSRHVSGALGVLAAAATTLGATPSVVTHADTAVAGRLTLVAQQFEVAATGSFVIELDLPSTLPITEVTDATVRITAYPRATSRAAVQAAADGALGRQVDSMQVPVAGLSSSGSADLQVAVPVETDTRTSAALQLSRAGVYPVKVEIVRGSTTLATITTFVHRLDENSGTAIPLQVTAVAGTTSAVTVGSDSEVVVDDASLAELGRLAEVLQTSAMPVTVRVAPSVIAALDTGSDEGAQVSAAFRAAITDDDLIAQPLLPLDPSAAAAVIPDRYTVWLREGEDALAVVAAEPPSRSVAFVDHPISVAGATLVRDLGARLLVATPEVWNTLAPAELGGTNQGAVLEVALDGASIPMAVVDPVIAQRIAEGHDRPELTAITVAAELVALHDELLASGDNPNTHAVVIGAADLGVPDASVFAAVTRLIASSEGLQAVRTDQLGLRNVAITDAAGVPLTGSLPDQPGSDITGRVTLSAALQNESADVAAMLSPGTTRPAEWTRLSDRLVTEAMTDEQAAALATQIRTELSQIRGSVQLPKPFSFTLTGRRSTVRIKLTNTSDEPLMVQLRLISPKLLFPDGPQTVTLEPAQVTEVEVAIEARTNGKIPVTLEVYTPNGRTRLGFPVPLSARVSAITGLGNLVTGVLALVLLTWWVRHVRTNRRARAAAEAAGRHPVGAPRSDVSGLSPDAEASTLPDS